MDFPPMKIALVITNFSMLSFLVVLMIDHYKSNNNLFSWSSSFNFLCLIWLTIRGVFWLRTVTSTAPWGVFSFYFLYWLPNPIQFGSYMLLPLFFTQILYPEEWKKYWISIRPAYYFFIISLVAFQILWAFLAALEKQSQKIKCADDFGDESSCFHTEYSSDVFRFVTFVCFSFLAACQGAFAFKISKLEEKNYRQYFSLSPKMMIIVNCILVFIFLSKGIYQLGAIFENYLLPDISLQGSSDIDFKILLSFEIWEYIPTILLIMTVTSKTVGSAVKMEGVSLSLKSTSLWQHMRDPKASLGTTGRGYGSFAIISCKDDDDVVSVNSDTPALTSSFEKSARLLFHQTSNISISPSSVGRFEMPSTLNPKSSWLSIGGAPKSQEKNNQKTELKTYELHDSNEASQLCYPVSASSSFQDNSFDRGSKRYDQYMISLRHEMKRGYSEGSSPSSSYSNLRSIRGNERDRSLEPLIESSGSNFSRVSDRSRKLSWGENQTAIIQPYSDNSPTIPYKMAIYEGTVSPRNVVVSRNLSGISLKQSIASSKESEEIRQNHKSGNPSSSSTRTVSDNVQRGEVVPPSETDVVTAVPKPTRFPRPREVNHSNEDSYNINGKIKYNYSQDNG